MFATSNSEPPACPVTNQNGPRRGRGYLGVNTPGFVAPASQEERRRKSGKTRENRDLRAADMASLQPVGCVRPTTGSLAKPEE
jgi:hypothetical protein